MRRQTRRRFVSSLAALGAASAARSSLGFLAPKDRCTLFSNLDETLQPELFADPNRARKHAAVVKHIESVLRRNSVDARLVSTVQMCPERPWIPLHHMSESRRALLNLHTLVFEAADTEQLFNLLRGHRGLHISKPSEIEYSTIPSDYYANNRPTSATGNDYFAPYPSYHYENYVVGLYDGYDRLVAMLAEQGLTLSGIQKTTVGLIDALFLPLHPDMGEIQLINGHYGMNSSTAENEDLYVIEPNSPTDPNGATWHGIRTQGVLFGVWDGGDPSPEQPGGVTGHGVNLVKALLLSRCRDDIYYRYGDRGPADVQLVDAVDLGARVASCSWGYCRSVPGVAGDPRQDPVFGPLYAHVFERDLAVVAAFTNTGPDACAAEGWSGPWPAKMQQVLGVGSVWSAWWPVDQGLHIAPNGYHLQEHGLPNLLAPGSAITTFSDPENDRYEWYTGSRWYEMGTGNSFATPIVAAIVGIIRALDPDMTTQQIKGFLYKTARPVSGMVFDYTVAGVPDYWRDTYGVMRNGSEFSVASEPYRVINLDNALKYWDRRYDEWWLGLGPEPRRPGGRHRP